MADWKRLTEEGGSKVDINIGNVSHMTRRVYSVTGAVNGWS
jgi:hypothetical protein